MFLEFGTDQVEFLVDTSGTLWTVVQVQKFVDLSDYLFFSFDSFLDVLDFEACVASVSSQQGYGIQMDPEAVKFSVSLFELGVSNVQLCVPKRLKWASEPTGSANHNFQL